MTLQDRHYVRYLITAISLLALAGCGGGDDNPVEPEVNNPPTIASIEVKLGSTVLDPSDYESIPVGQMLSITCTASDPDNDQLTMTWSASLGSFNRTDSSCVEWTAPGTAGTALLTLVVSDGVLSDEDTTEFVVVQSATLSDGMVSPRNGVAGTTFNYQVIYTDPSNQGPNSAEVVIDGQAYTMVTFTGDPIGGATFSFPKSLGSGMHEYYFRFIDSRDSTIVFPSQAYSIGPIVSDPGTLLGEDLVLIDELSNVELEAFDESSVTLTYTATPPQLNPGHIVAGSDEGSFLREVVSATTTGGQITVETTPTTLGEVLLTGSSDTIVTFALSPAEPPVTVAGGGITLTEGVYINADVIDIDNMVLQSGTVGSAEVTALITDGSITYEPDFDYAVAFEDGNLTNFRALANGEYSFSFDVSIITDGPVVTSAPIEVAMVRINHPVVQFVDWFPVRQELIMTFVAGLELETEIAGEAVFGHEGVSTISYGSEYNGTSWTDSGEDTDAYSGHFTSWTDYGDFRARVYIRPEIEVKIYSVTGAYLDAGIYADFDGTVTTDPSCHWAQYGGTSASFEAVGDVLHSDLADYESDLVESEETIFDQDCFATTLTADESTLGETGVDEGRCVAATPDGGMVVTGSTNSRGAGGYDVFLTKLNSSGSVEWDSTYGGIGDDFGYSVITTSDGGYAIAGHTRPPGVGELEDVGDVYVIKTNATGHTVWQQTIGGARYDAGHCIVETSDNGFAIAGRTRPESDPTKPCDLYLVKLEANGNGAWTKTYGGSGSDRAYALVETTDGGFALTGYNGSYGPKNLYLVKTDQDGILGWERVETVTSGDDCGYSIVEAEDGGLVVAGLTPLDPFLIKFRPSDGGKLFERKNLGGPSLDGFYSVMATVDGGFLMTGFLQNDFLAPSDVYLMKTDELGIAEWHYRLGGVEVDEGLSVTGLVGGGYAVVGRTLSFGSGDWDAYLIMLTEN